jgi:hypothetical protein
MPRNQGRPRASAPVSSPSSLRRSNSSLAPAASKPSSNAVTRGHEPAASKQQSSSSGMAGSLLGNVASTAAGVAIGHSIGNAITGLFSGGVTPEPGPTAHESSDQMTTAGPCGFLMKELTQCIEVNGNAGPCQWIFDQVNICQRAAQSNSNSE